MTRHLLDVDDLVPGRAGLRARPGHGRVPSPRPGRPGGRAGFPKAVGPDPQLVGGGRLPARGAPGDHPGRRGGHRHPGKRRRRSPDAGAVPRRHRRPGVRPRRPRAHGRGGRRARDQPFVRPLSPAPGHRRPADAAAHWGGKLAGHRVAWVGDGNNVARSLALACACPVSSWPWPRRPATASTMSPSTPSVAWGGTVMQALVARRGGGRGGRGVHRRLGLHGPGGRAGGAPWTPSRPTR